MDDDDVLRALRGSGQSTAIDVSRAMGYGYKAPERKEVREALLRLCDSGRARKVYAERGLTFEALEAPARRAGRGGGRRPTARTHALELLLDGPLNTSRLGQCVYDLAELGHVRSVSRGVWEITEAGRGWLADTKERKLERGGAMVTKKQVMESLDGSWRTAGEISRRVEPVEAAANWRERKRHEARVVEALEELASDGLAERHAEAGAVFWRSA